MTNKTNPKSQNKTDFVLPNLETNRLILRKITLRDARDIFDYAKDPSVSRYTLWYPHKSLSDTRQYIGFVKKNYRLRMPENWGIVYKADNRLIGTIGLFNLDPANKKAEIHYALSNKYSGRGIMSEAVSKVIQFGFNKLHLNRIEARCMLMNMASERVMQKCGMQYEGIMRKGLFSKGKFVDLKMYAILKNNS